MESSKIEKAILSLLAERDSNSSVCPSEVARSLSDDWRKLMPEVRQAADRLQRSNKISVLQKGRPIESAVLAKGPIRLKLRF